MKELQNRRALDHHWSDYASLCHPCDIHYDYISKTETFVHDVEFLQRRLGLNTAQPYTNRSFVRIPIYNSHQRSPRRDVRSSRDVEVNGCRTFARWRKSLKEFENVSSADFKQILELYSSDMKMFGYAWNGDLLEAECDGLCC